MGKLQGLNSYSAAAGLRISPQEDQLLYVGTEGTRTDTSVAQLSRATRPVSAWRARVVRSERGRQMAAAWHTRTALEGFNYCPHQRRAG